MLRTDGKEQEERTFILSNLNLEELVNILRGDAKYNKRIHYLPFVLAYTSEGEQLDECQE
jgi:hypothetical protein